jgi:hypothetical protein
MTHPDFWIPKYMRPTMDLRFVQQGGRFILQQKWLSDDKSVEEWRAVPLVNIEESANG